MNKTLVSIALALVLAIGTSVVGCREARLRNRLKAAEQNVAALADSVRYERNKAGELEAVRRTLAASKNQLETLNASLHEELRKERGNVKTITITEVVVRRDTVEVEGELSQWSDSMASASFAFRQKHEGGRRVLEGRTDIWPDSSRTTITRDELALRLVVGLRERDGLREVFGRTSFPGVTLDIEGAEINPEWSRGRRKTWALGPSFSVGVDPDELVVRKFVGISLTYSLIRF